MGLPVGHPAPRPWRTAHWLAAAALLLLSLSLGWITRAPEISIGGDEATYILLSRSLEHGSYRDEFLPGSPLHAKYPPGTSLWIAGLRQVLGPNVDGVRGANLLLLALTAVLLGDAVRRVLGSWPGIAAAGLTALSPPLLNLAGTALSEPPYLALTVVALWATLRAEPDGGTRWIVVAVAAALASFLTRTVGFTVVATVLLWMLWRRLPRRQIVSAIAVSAAVVGGWFAYTAYAATLTGVASTYGDNLRHVAAPGGTGEGGLLLQAAGNAKEYALMLPFTLGVPTIPGTIADNLVAVLILGAAGAAGLLFLVRRWPAAVVYGLLSVTVLLIWPWPIERLLYPLLPFVFAALVAGSFRLVTMLRPAARGAAIAGSLGLAAVLAVSAVSRYLAADPNRHCDRRAPLEDSHCFTPAVREFVAATHLLRDSAPAQAVIATGKPATVFYFSGHRVVLITDWLRPDRERGVLELGPPGVDWIFLSAAIARDQGAAKRALAPHCDQLREAVRGPPTTVILIARSLGDPAPTACAALEHFLTLRAE